MRRFLVSVSLTLLIGMLAGIIADSRKVADEERTKAFEHEFQQVEQLLGKTLASVLSEKDGLASYTHHWSDDGIGLVVYDEGVASEWTTNALPFPATYEERTKPADGLIKLKNAWYLCKTVEFEGQVLAGYAVIATEYGFRNRYVQNGWNPNIRSAEGFSITLSSSGTSPFHYADGSTAAYLRTRPTLTEPVLTRGAVLWLMFVALMFLSFWHAANWVLQLSTKAVSFTVFVLLLLVFRGLMLWWQVPKELYAIEVFDPALHATSAFVPSLGDLVIHVVMLLLILLRAWRTFADWRSEPAFLRVLLSALQVLAVYVPVLLIRSLVQNSSFSVHLNDPFSLNGYSILALLISFIGLLCLYLWVNLVSKWTGNRASWFQAVLGWSVGGLGLFLLLGTDSHALAVSLLAMALMGFLKATEKWVRNTDGISSYVPLTVAFTVLAAVVLMQCQHINEHETRKALAAKLEERQNPITEYLFAGLEEKILTDRALRNLLSVRPMDQEAILAMLHQLLAYDHWNQYVTTVHLFNDKGGILVSDDPTIGRNYFEWQRDFEASKPTMADHLRYVGNWNNEGGYMARLELKGRRSQENLILFLRLKPERSEDILGFTDLFVDEELSAAKELQGYSYAIYEEGRLQEKHGDFPYSLSDVVFKDPGTEGAFLNLDGYEHLIDRSANGQMVVISKLNEGYVDHLTIFSYLFLLYFVFATLAAMLEGRFWRGIFTDASFRNRINLAMGSVLLFSMLLIGALTVMYVVRGYDNRNQEMISERSRSILIELQGKLGDRDRFSEADVPLLTTLLNKFSRVFFTDINMYQVNGHLLATSRPRLYDEGLMAKVLDHNAYMEMRFNQRSSFIQEETVGQLNYLTAYVPFRNDKGEVIAFMSLPYFARQYGLQQEVLALLAALTNIYVFLILLSVVLALFISNRITEPLRIIRESLKDLKLDRTNRAIEWKSNDEIGELVQEYNQTLNELVRSAEMLARSERESAWREMAKQVAHEIKNPLTPMKLSIQMLQRSMNDGAEDLNQRIDRTSKTLIEQIDTLSHIATEFSSFAQMPKANLQKTDLREILENAVELHRNSEAAVVLELNGLENCELQADREQLLRVFNNLIKNGIQAIPEDRNGRINIVLKQVGNEWHVAVSDNGSGIPEEVQELIFVPNFTTKSSGMGLGLAMVKSMVESIDGRIWFETSPAGTTFHLAFPMLA